MSRCRLGVAALIGLAVPLGAAEVEPVSDSIDTPVFSRLSYDESRRPLSLDVAIATYLGEDASGPFAVDLIGAVHVGESDYYQALNERFDDYDAVLYELVAPPNTRIDPEKRKARGLLSGGQRMLQSLLDLTFQLDEIDYGADNLVHADLSPDEFREEMDLRDESVASYFRQSFNLSLRQQMADPYGGRAIYNLWRSMTSDQDSVLRTLLAQELANAENLDALFGGDTAIVDARNQRALDVLRRELGNGHRRIGIFYGVGHMADFDERLTGADWSLQRGESIWIPAWWLQRNARQPDVDE